MKSNRFLMAAMFAALTVCLFMIPAPAAATTISFGSDGVNESNSLTGTNVAITADSSWITLSGGVWESYAQTGFGGSVEAPVASIPGAPTANFTENLATGTDEILSLNVLADDTASVTLFDSANPTGLLLKAADPTQGTHCANAPVTCTETWTTTDIAVSAGPAELVFGAYQRVADSPFGIDYAGTVDVQSQATAPEPATLGLIGGGLLLLGGLRPRKNKQANN